MLSGGLIENGVTIELLNGHNNSDFLDGPIY